MKVRCIRGASIASGSAQWIRLLAFVLIVWLAFGLTPLRADSSSLTDNKKSHEKLCRSGHKAIRSGKYDEAVKTFKNVLNFDDKNLRAHLGISLAYLKLQDYGSCFDHANLAIKTDPNSARAYSLAGMALLRAGYIGNAILALNRALELDKKDALAFGAAAEVDYYEGRAKESRMKALYAYSLDPD